MLAPTRITAPVGALVTTDEIKVHCRVDYPDDDALLDSFVQAAVDHLDGWRGVLGRCIITQTWRAAVGEWPAGRIQRLPFPDTSAVVIKYSDADNSEQVLSSALYSVVDDSAGSLIRYSNDFTAPTLYADRMDPVRIEQECGFGTVSDVPEALKTAVKMMAAHWYEQREAVVAGISVDELPMGPAALIAPFRRVAV